MSDNLAKENYTSLNKERKDADISLEINTNNNLNEGNKIELQEDFTKETNISGTTKPLEIIKDTESDNCNLENTNRYGQTIPFLFISGEPFISISPNCKIKNKKNIIIK